MTSAQKDALMPPLPSPLRRKRLHTQDNFRVSNQFSSSSLKKPRFNTLQNDEQSPLPLVRKATSSKPILSPVKFYQTKLAVSCEAWSAYSIIDKAYKRGWKPNCQAEFSGLVRLVAAAVYLQMLQQHLEVSRLAVRVNRCLLAQQEKQPVREVQKQRFEREERALAQNTIIPLRDLVAAMLITNSQELVVYSALFLGYAASRLNENSQSLINHPQPAIIDSYAQGAQYCQMFVQRGNAVLKRKYPNSEINNSLEFYSTPHELSQFFAELTEKYTEFLGMLQSKEVISGIRFQMGFKFYQDRTKRFLSERVHPQGRVVLSCRGKTNFGVVCLSRGSGLVIVLQDCKFSMAQVDISRIEQRFKGTVRPGAQQSRLLPLLRLLQ